MSARTTGQNVYHDPRTAYPRPHYVRAGVTVPSQTLVGYRRGTTGNLAEPMTARADLIPLGISMSHDLDVAPTTNTESGIEAQAGLVGGLDVSSTAPPTEADYLAPVYAEDNFTIRRDNGDVGDGPVYSMLGIYMGYRENTETGDLMHMVWIPEVPASVDSGAAVSDLTSLTARAVKGAVGANIASLSAFTVASYYGVTYEEGDIVLLLAQSTAAQNGPYVVGEVDAGVAALTRPSWWATGSEQPTGAKFILQQGNGGAAGLELYASTTGGITVGTDSPAFKANLQDRDLPTVRGVVDANVADLTAFAVSGAGRDGLTYVAGDLVLLAAQTVGAESGPYVAGTVDTTAPLARPAWWITGSVQRAKAAVRVDAGTVWAGKEWFATLAGDITVGTSAPAFYPRTHDATTPAATGTPGVATISNLWMLPTALPTFSRKTTGGTPGHVSITTQTAGAGDGVLALTSTGNETSTFNVHVQNG